MLSDRDIRTALDNGGVVIDNVDRERIQPSSIDVTLHPTVLRNRPNRDNLIDTRLPVDTVAYDLIEDDGFTLAPHEFVLGSTYEVVSLSRSLVARVEGKSSLGRLGLLVHCTAGFVDAGFHGQVTLELYNAGGYPIRIYAGMPIAQLAFDWLGSAAEKPYAGKYQGQVGPVASRYYLNWDAERGTW